MKEKILALLIGFMALLVTGLSVQAQTATISSDQPDYKPGTIATFTGRGFLPGEQVKIQVLHAENHPVDYNGSEHEPWLVLADTSGNFQTTWKLSDFHCVGNVLRATAIGQTSGENVWHEFTDPLYTSKVIVGNWNDPSTWFDGIVPGAGDEVTIAVGATITVTDNRAASKITIAGGALNTKLQINPGITLNVTGDVSINPPGTANITNELAVGAGTFLVGGNLIIGGALSKTGIFSISTGTTTVKGRISPNGNTDAQIRFTGSGTLKVSGSLAETASTFIAGTGTVEYNGSVAQIISNYKYHNLIVSNGAKLNAETSISGLLTLTKTLDLANKKFTVGSLTGSGNLAHLSGTNDARSLTIGTDNTSPAPFSGNIDDGNANWLNVTKTGSGTLTLSGNNTYTGGTFINNGTLSVNKLTYTNQSSSIGTGASISTISIAGTGVLKYTGTGHSSNRSVILNGNGATLDASGTGTLGLSGSITGTDYNLVLTGTGNAIHSGVIGTAAGSLTKSGSGTWTLSGANTYTGVTSINSGVLSVAVIGNGGVTGTSNLGRATSIAANLVLGGGTLQYTGLTASTNRGFTLISGTTSSIDVTTNNLTISGASASTTGSLLKTGAGILTLSGDNLYTGSTVISAGTLQLGAAEKISNSSNIVLNGGTFNSGASTGFSETVGTLTLSDNSTISLGTGSHTLTFQNSNGVSWTTGKTLNITGWTGAGGSSGTAGRIVVGAGGLSATQLSSIRFTGYPAGAIVLASGEIVPPLAITITSPLTASSTYGVSSSYQITASNLPTTFDATELPAGMTLNNSTGLISVAATTPAGTYTINISATNGSNTDSKTLLYTIDKADQTISFPVLANKTFGDAPFTLTATASSGLEPNYLSSNTAVAMVSGNTVTILGAGTTMITASLIGNPNYNAAAAVLQELTVDRASQTITFETLSAKTYGEEAFTLAATASSGLTVSYVSSNPAVATVSGNMVTIVGAGTTTFAASQTGNNDYSAATFSQVLTVNKAELVVTADDKVKVYGAADPELNYTPTGNLFYGDTYGVISGVNLSTTTGAAATFGFHSIIASGGTAANYNLTFINGTLTVDKASLVVTADDKTKVYGAEEPLLTYTPTGTLFYNDTYGVISGVNLSTVAGADATFGTHQIVASGGTADNYKVNLVDGSLLVDKAALTVTSEDKSREYGEANPAFTGIFSGQAYNENFKVSGSSMAIPTSTVGEYNIFPEVSGPTLINYHVIPVTGTLTVSRASLIITAADKSREYGESNPLFTGSFTGQKNNETFTIGGSSAATATSSFGDYSIVPSVTGTTLANYNISPVNGKLTVTKAILNVSAPNQSLSCGQSLVIPSTGTFSGAKNNETFIVSGTTTGTMSSGPGIYPIAPAVSGLTLHNYNVIGTDGILTISGVTIDANANVTPRPVSTTATLVTIKVTNIAGTAVPGVSVVLYVDDKNGMPGSTDETGTATFNLGVLAADVYRLRAVAGSGCSETTAYMPIYDPTGGFVTGGGWINSPVYATLDYMKVGGKANFGFVSKYEKGKTIPSGNTEFQFKEGGMNFTSTSFDWLVISGNKSQYKGTGTINGSGSFGFILTATDGDLTSVKSADLFRIKIYDKITNRTVYDNQYGTGTTPDDADPTTALGGGSIVIHEVKTGKVASTTPLAGTTPGLDMRIVEPVIKQIIKLSAYPNPFGKQATISFTLPTDEHAVTLDVYDLKGSKIQRMYQGKAAANQTLDFEFNGHYLSPGMYFLRLTTPKKVENFKMIMTE